MNAARLVEHCRICESGDLRGVLRVGVTPLANAFVAPEHLGKAEARFPLELARCAECGLAQLTVVVDSHLMFGDYVYASSASAPLLEHFDAQAEDLVQRFAPQDALVVEFGSNDGVLLEALSRRGVRALGVEPAANLAAVANAAGRETLNAFFGPELAARIRQERGPADIVVGNNVLAHIDDLRGVAASLVTLLAPDGVFVAEVPYLPDLLEEVEYDTIYHEHLSYFHVAPLRRLFADAGLQLFDVVRLPIHGGSIRIHVARGGRRRATDRLRDLEASESQAGLDTDAPFERFASRVERQREALVALLDELSAKRTRLAAYGATAKGNTLLSYCGIDRRRLEFVVDTTPYKQGLLTPGTHIPVRPESALAESPPDVLLLLAWNYADAILARHQDFIRRGGRFIHPIPLPRLIPETA